MKTIIILILALNAFQLQAQDIVGTWQLTNEGTCLESQFKESETEKELLPDMQSSSNSVARVIVFDKRGKGEEGVFSSGKKRGAEKNAFKYKVNDNQLVLLDPKSGIMTQQLVIDELTAGTLRLHNSAKDCETKTFTRIK